MPGIRLLEKMNGKPEVDGTRKDLIQGGIACGLLLFAASSLQQMGIQYTTAGKAGFITAFYIVFVPVLGIFLKKAAGWKVWMSVFLALIGLYFLCIKEGFSIGKGDIMIFACALVFAVHIPDHEGHATEDYAITCKVCGWVMEEQVKQIQMEIPYKLVVKKTGEADPTKETFKFVIEEFGAPVEYKIISDAIETNGEKTYNGTFTFTINSNLLGNISEGFVLRQIKGNASGWTYDETSYYVVPHINENGAEDWAFYKLDKDRYINEENEVREAVFTNSYNAKKAVAPVQKKAPDDKMKSPKTGNDSLMVIWTTMILAAALAFIGLTTVSHRRK